MALLNNTILVIRNTALIPNQAAICPPNTEPATTPKYPADMLKPNALPVRKSGEKQDEILRVIKIIDGTNIRQIARVTGLSSTRV